MKMMKNFVLGLVAAGFVTGCAMEAADTDEVREISQDYTDPDYTYEAHPNESDLTWQGTDHAVVSRMTGDLEVLTVEGGKVQYRRFDNGWLAAVDLGRPIVGGTARNLTSVAAVRNGNRIDVFAVASNNKIYHRFTGNSVSNRTFASGPVGGWFEITNHPTVRSGSDLAVTSWGAGRLDLFWTTTNKNIGHAWADQNIWGGVETGDSPSSYGTYNASLNPSTFDIDSLAAVSWGPGRIDVFASYTDIMTHVWYGGGWGRENFGLVAKSYGFSPTSFAVTSRGVGILELFAGSVDGVRHTWFKDGAWHKAGTKLDFKLIGGTFEDETPNNYSYNGWTVQSGVIFNGGRTDLFGVYDNQGSHTLWDLTLE